MTSSAGDLEKIDKILGEIIDEWYDRVSSYYLTAERLAEDPSLEGEEELKRFHDDTGHRIKFAKDDLDFTYGLRGYAEGGDLIIEVSVNNKVKNFDLEEFRKRLAVHYRKAATEKVPTPFELRNRSYGEIFLLDSDFSDALRVEQREGKADIVRLAFRLNHDFVERLLAHPVSSKQLVENFCVTPFRQIYATVYRRGS
ncbi:MAG: hypothetical protein Kow00109_25260 [Acidobacteriota bacterium]